MTSDVMDTPNSVPVVRDQGSSAFDNPDTDIEILKTIPKDFAIDCADHANWLVRKVIEARAYSERVKAWAEQEQRRAAREEQTLMFLFGRQIESWTKSEIEKLGGRRKSLSLPAGRVGYRKCNAKLVVDDEQVVLAWAKENCAGAVVVVERLSKSALDDFVATTGAFPERGAHIEPQAERFYVK